MSEREKFDPVMDWLGAYLDGELNETRRGWVEDHLATCAECRGSLKELRALSTLLHMDPDPRPSKSADAFAADIRRRLSSSMHPGWQGNLRKLMRFAPLGLFATWAFFQAVIWVAGGLLLGLNLVPGGEQVLAQLEPLTGPSTAGTLNAWLTNALPGAGTPGAVSSVAWVAQISWLSPFAIISVIVTMLVAGLFLAWMAGVLVARRAAGRELA